MDNENKSSMTEGAKIVDKLADFMVKYMLLIYALAGVILYVVGFGVREMLSSDYLWLHEILKGVGEALMIAVLIGFAFEKYIRKEKEEKEEKLMESWSKKISDEVTKKVLMLDEKEKKRLIEELASTSSNDVIKEMLKTIASDDEMGERLYYNLNERIFKYKEKWFSYVQEATLYPINDKEFYEISIYFKYTTILMDDKLRFVCTSDKKSHEKFVEDEKYTYSYYLPRVAKMDSNIFTVEEVKVGGEELQKTNGEEIGSSYIVTYSSEKLKEKLNERVDIIYRIRTKIRKSGEFFFVKFVRSAKGPHISFDASGVDEISSIEAVDFVVSSETPTITYEQKKIKVSVEDWVFPKTGVIFIWRIKNNKE